MSSLGRAVLLAAVVLALGAGAAAAAVPPIPPPTGNTVTITVEEVAGRLAFVGPETVVEGDELEVVNKTNPQKVGPIT
ncbi:MAG TPA: hypothetical protein VJL81_14935, partial [Solirubrobacterales bacterium]|nr:hypothetical protein [Solirubrobacterales bacterium]